MGRKDDLIRQRMLHREHAWAHNKSNAESASGCIVGATFMIGGGIAYFFNSGIVFAGTMILCFLIMIFSKFGLLIQRTRLRERHSWDEWYLSQFSNHNDEVPH